MTMAGNIRAFAQQLNANALLKTQSVQQSEKIILADSVDAGQRKLCRASVSNYGDFLCLFITGSFVTMNKYTLSSQDYLIDTGVDFLRGQLSDSIGQRKLFNDFIPFSLWVTPGRRKSATALNNVTPVPSLANPQIAVCEPSNQLFYPQEFEYIFAANREILLDVYNDSNNVSAPFSGTTLSFEIVFHGIRILSDTAVSGVREMRR
jgi:hypothetical protein